MTYAELLNRVKQIKNEEVRQDTGTYLEVVFKVSSLKELDTLLVQYFGGAFKPAGKPPSKEMEKNTQSFGGIRANQTLYFVENQGLFYCTLIWPWSDGKLATVKIAQYKRN